MTMDIGFIGLGVMGTPMAKHLARAGHRLTLLDANAAIARDLAGSLGGDSIAVATPREVAERSDVIITMLPNGQVVRQVVLGDDGVIHGLRSGALVLDTSSCEPWLTEETARALAGRGGGMVDAPVSGAQWGAQEASLVFMVGGSPGHVARIRPLLDVMGRAVFHLGGVGSGHAMKCINNCITAITLANTAEGLVAGKRYGLDPQVMVEVLNESTGGSWITRTHFNQRVFNRAFDDPFKLELMLKDVGIALELARETATPVPIWGLGQQLWRMADHAAGPGASVSELVRWVERQSGTELTPGARPRGSGDRAPPPSDG
ncbi:NAD(P)-dependent oxidoreductase [Ramlibacter sp. Leaf400]|uniref:NAD(P)-dependent oxidoreductase n=1 Tax=Ramlibacter sp. Leaf400 TaxID=1736365 RepID=UPI0006F41DD1|nr:NAD(P)-dependent oxidoreductase [Ramlibacter sp. Leaf400]KQT10927.1 6-phosphogluconate dehydrogenase [Ramlibacter sp. Leaf400]